MSDHTPILLTPMRIDLDSPAFEEIRGWPFTGHHSYIGRRLQDDIAQRVYRGPCRLWIYLDPAGRNVGFGTLDERDYYSSYSDGRLHLYIPLLAANPTIKSLGYGTSIVKHLISEATLIAFERDELADTLFLDVYKDNDKAIELYKKYGFNILEDEPTPDPDEKNRPYFIMAAGISVIPT
jgi:ribosomal protein S18 acetylase RimI-like enzyme